MTRFYQRNTTGHILHALRALGVGEHIAGEVTVSQNKIHLHGKHFADWRCFDGIEQPLFRFCQHYHHQQAYVLQEDGMLRPSFRLSLGPGDHASLEVSGSQFFPELHDFISTELFTSWTDKSGYALRNNAGAFFQGGAHSRDSGWLYIEFWKPEGAQACVDFINQNFRMKDPNPPRPYD